MTEHALWKPPLTDEARLRIGEPALESVLQSWLGLYAAAGRPARHVELWRFTERTHLGLLAAAALMNGHPAHEEIATDKKRPAAERTAGRCDLVLQLTEAVYFVEAKRWRPWLRSSEDLAATRADLPKRLLTTRRDVRSTRKGGRGIRRISLLVITPRIKVDEPTRAAELGEAFLARMHAELPILAKVDLWSGWFPGEAYEEGSGAFRNAQGVVFPGVLVIGKVHTHQATAQQAA